MARIDCRLWSSRCQQVDVANALYAGGLNPTSSDAMEFMRRIAEHELSIYDQSCFRLYHQRGMLFIEQKIEIELQLDNDSEPKILIGALEAEDPEPSDPKLWADVFAEAAHSGYMLVRFTLPKRGMAYCTVRAPDWV
jgi:hypothetical protein